MNHCDLLLHAAHIVTQDEKRRILHDASIAIADGRILDIGTRNAISPLWEPATERDLGHALVLPGLINAHTHAAMTFLRGFADDLPLVTWLKEKIFPLEASLTKEIVRTGSLLGFAEMLKTGTTRCLDMYMFSDEVFAAAETAGIGLAAGEPIFKFPSASATCWQEELEHTVALSERFASSTRLQVMISPHAVYTSTPDILTACVRASEEYNLPLHMHLAESGEETKECLSQHGSRPIPYCQALGLFDRPLTIAHVVDADEHDVERLKKASDTVIVHNPGSNMKLASGVAKIPTFLGSKMPVALGTDGPASNNQLNMFLEMNRAALLHKLSTMHPETLPAEAVLDMATRNGAKALHRKDLGALIPGNLADLTVLNEQEPNLTPLYDPISQCVYAASGHEVILTMVEGEILYDHGTFTKFSYEDLWQEMEAIKDSVTKNMA
ncbi:MAG: amidohydrolase [Desulfovibrio sp.]|nr:amidohydrolase [Desulfovibrio sp.]